MATITVTSLGDTIATDGVVTLREAIEAANTDAASGDAPAGSGTDSIVFASGLSGSIVLTDTLHITSNISISGDSDGNGSIDIALDGNHLHQILWISGSSVVTLDTLRLTHGSWSVAPAIDAEDATEVTVRNSEIVDNVAGKYAGAISADGASMTIIGSTLSGNAAAYDGGAITSTGSNVLTIIDSTISGNSAQLGGGGVSAYGSSSVVIVNTTFSQNATAGHPSDSQGGGLYLGNTGGTTLTNVTIAGNAAQLSGGGIYLTSTAAVTIANSTISLNTGSDGSGVFAEDGAIVNLANTVIAGNLSSPDIGKDTGTTGFFTQGGNFIGDGDGLMIDGASGDRVGTTGAPLDPKLGALANNGGPVQTMAPLAGSPLIDGGRNGALPLDTNDIDNDGNTAERLSLDATGQARIENAVLDIGAFEVRYNDAPTITIQGNLDAVTANGATDTLSVLLGNGLGGLGSATSVVAGVGPDDVALGDLDGDGTLDAVVVNTGDDTLMVFRGDGRGGFAAPEPYAFTKHGPVDVVLGDLNGDGHLDIVKTNIDDTIEVLLNDGSGHFTAGTPLVSHGRTLLTELADLNGDGHLDAVTTNNTDATVSVRLGDGSGGFAPSVDIALGDDPEALALGDFDGDGNVDIAVTTRFNDTLIVVPGDGAGGFGPKAIFAGGGGFGAAPGDFDNDGDLDIATTDAFGNVSVRLGNGLGGFAAATGYPTGSTKSLRAGDLNGDGNLDIVAVSDTGAVRVLIGNGAGDFAAPVSFGIGSGAYGLALGDLDNARVTAEDTAIVFDAAHGNAITLGDVDSGGLDETLTLTVAHGALTLASTAGLTAVSGNGTGTVTLTGSMAELNAAIDGLTYQPALDYNGKDKLSVSLDDGGNTGAGGDKTAKLLVPIVVTPVSDAPTGSDNLVITEEDTPYVFTVAAFAFDDADGDGFKAVKIETLPASGVLKLDGVTITAPTSIDIALIAAGKLIYVPAANANGSGIGSFTFRVEDDGGLGTSLAAYHITLDVNAINDAPTLAASQVTAALKETADTSVSIKIADLTVGDIDGGTNTLSLSGADKDLFLVHDGDLYLKAGARLDFEKNPVLDVTVTLDDAGAGASPDGSVSLSVAITDVVETLVGNSRPNVLRGTGADEMITGKGGDDTIKGGGGADTIRGGPGTDVMTGGKGPDVFVFKPGDLPRIDYLDRWLSPLNSDHDLIKDFKPGTDTIDLSAIDANTHKDGNQKFHFEGEGTLSGSRGELVYQFYGKSHSVILGDTNGDSDYDLLIVLKGHHHLDKSDFVL